MKHNEIKIPMVRCDLVNFAGFKPGIAKVIGKLPKCRPYINIEDCNGNLVVSLDAKQIESIIKKWKTANP